MNMSIHITNREPLMRQIIYDMMNQITEGYERTPFQRDLLIAIPNIAIASSGGAAGIRQEWLVRAIRMEPNGVRGHNALRAVKIRFARAYRRLPPEIHRNLGRDPFFPMYGNGDNRVHRMNEGLAEFITDWAFEHEGFLEWAVLMGQQLQDPLMFDANLVYEEE